MSILFYLRAVARPDGSTRHIAVWRLKKQPLGQPNGGGQLRGRSNARRLFATRQSSGSRILSKSKQPCSPVYDLLNPSVAIATPSMNSFLGIALSPDSLLVRPLLRATESISKIVYWLLGP